MSITLYTTPSCPWCTRAKEYLRYRQVGFNEVNVASNQMAAMDMVRKSGQRSVPVLDIDGNIVIGFNQTAIDRLIR